MANLTKIIGTIAVLALTAGCSTSKPGPSETRDFAAFFLAHSLKFGAKPVNTNTPPLYLNWQYEEDQNGFQVKTEKENFTSIERFLNHSFGKPAMPVKHTKDMTLGVYSARQAGVAIQFGMEGKNSFVTLVRGLSYDELSRSTLKAFGIPDYDKTNSPPQR